MRWGLWIGIVALLVCAVWYYDYEFGGAPLEVVPATSGPIKEFVDERAQTRLPNSIVITMPYSGRVEAIALSEGETVKAGQILARIVPEDLKTQLDVAQAAVDRLDASLRENDDLQLESSGLKQALRYVEAMEQAVASAAEQVRASAAKRDVTDRQFKRMRLLKETNRISDEEFEKSELELVEANVDYQTDVLNQNALLAMQAATNLMPEMVKQYISRKGLASDVLKVEKSEAQARLKQAQLDFERGVMRSPVAGVVLKRHHSVERALTSGTELLEIGQLEQLEVEIEVLSQDAVRIQTGLPVDIYGPAIGGKAVAGVVERIYPAGFTKISSLGVEQQRVKVVVKFSSKEELQMLLKTQGLGVGYRVRARIYTAEKTKGVLVPRSAVFRNPAGNWEAFVVRERVAESVSLKIGLMNDEQVEVLQGIEEGTQVVLAPESSLTDGTRLRPLLREPPQPIRLDYSDQ